MALCVHGGMCFETMKPKAFRSDHSVALLREEKLSKYYFKVVNFGFKLDFEPHDGPSIQKDGIKK
jgi:hypothetical protein